MSKKNQSWSEKTGKKNKNFDNNDKSESEFPNQECGALSLGDTDRQTPWTCIFLGNSLLASLGQLGARRSAIRGQEKARPIVKRFVERKSAFLP